MVDLTRNINDLIVGKTSGVIKDGIDAQAHNQVSIENLQVPQVDVDFQTQRRVSSGDLMADQNIHK